MGDITAIVGDFLLYCSTTIPKGEQKMIAESQQGVTLWIGLVIMAVVMMWPISILTPFWSWIIGWIKAKIRWIKNQGS